jgi:alpha-L-fucosidase 2
MMKRSARLVCVFAFLLSYSAQAQSNKQQPNGFFPILPQLDSCNVSWDEPGPGSAQSMPIGNGDIGLNLWVEKNGDLVFYISKTDAWGGATRPEWDSWMKEGGVLMKLGEVRVSMTPSPLKENTSFLQVLRLHEGEISIKEGETSFHVWVDANNPVIRIEANSPQPAAIEVSLNDWRLGEGDSIIPAEKDRLTWYHANDTAAGTHLAGIVFGAMIKAKGFRRKDAMTLESGPANGSKLISIYPLTTMPAATSTIQGSELSPGAPAVSLVPSWRSQLGQQVNRIDRLVPEQTRTDHRRWWDQFWHRSWVFVHSNQQADITTNQQAEATTKGYVLQRYVTACAGRGAFPIKFNGSIFVVDNPRWQSGNHNVPMSADFRAWGGQYWFQNTRAMYWPRLMAGDFDLMLPLFNMYAKMLPVNAALVKKYYNHDGAYFQETTPFWGGLPYMGPEVDALYTHHYFTPILELSMMMLDYYEYTGDTSFARNTLLPIVSAGTTFFDQHFDRDIMGKLLLDPDNSIEMFWKVRDPAPDLSALHAILPRLIHLPGSLVDATQRDAWEKLLTELPPLPIGATADNKPVLLPYTGQQTAKSFNTENPELYAIYPYRIYGLHRPDLEMARTTFLHRKFRDKGCWVQDPIQAAMLGFADLAREYTTFNFMRKDPSLKFPAFWAKGNDYMPDEDNGGNGENGLQQMLLQTDGKKILLLPAWPKDWDADFKLNAPYRTTITGRVVHGRLTDLVVTPASRAADVIDMSASDTAFPFTGEKTSWHEGFDRYDFLMDAQSMEITSIKAMEDEHYGAKPAEKGKLRCIVVAPAKAAPGNPWLWRGCYWDHEPQVDVDLLKRGFHIAFIMCDPDEHWDTWYDFLTKKHGFSKKPAFTGMSRGGINEFAWATVNPDKVSCIYADNPALRPESFARLSQLAKYDVPLLHVCGSYDFLLQQHTLAVEDIYHRLGGRISLIIKEGPGHHPHSQRDPALIAGWIEENSRSEAGTPPAIPGLLFDRSYYYSYANTYRHLQPEDIYATCRGPLFTNTYERYDVNNGSDLGVTGMTILVPKKPAPGNPWVFKADRIGREAEPVDLALLAKGFYIVSPPVTAQAGPLQEQWDECYRQLTALGFSHKPVMEGTGAGGGEAYFWAIHNPEKVSCIYAENPILRSLQAKAPLSDSLAPLAKAGIRILHVCGSLDPCYPPNTKDVEKKYRELGGQMKVMLKEGEGHFDVQPRDPNPIVDFIMATQQISSDHSGPYQFDKTISRSVWGYDEITWFAHQNSAYRSKWLRYAWDWVNKTDPNGHLEMPGSRTETSPLDHRKWYYANTQSILVPEGLGDEEAIRAIWVADPVK